LDDGFRSRWRAAARASAQASRGRPQQPERSGTSHLRDEHSRGNAWRQFLEASRQQMNSARAWLSRRWLGCKHAVVRPNRGRSSRKQEDTALNAPRDPQAMAFVLARPRRPGDVAFIILRDSMGLRAVDRAPRKARRKLDLGGNNPWVFPPRGKGGEWQGEWARVSPSPHEAREEVAEHHCRRCMSVWHCPMAGRSWARSMTARRGRRCPAGPAASWPSHSARQPTGDARCAAGSSAHSRCRSVRAQRSHRAATLPCSSTTAASGAAALRRAAPPRVRASAPRLQGAAALRLRSKLTRGPLSRPGCSAVQLVEPSAELLALS